MGKKLTIVEENETERHVNVFLNRTPYFTKEVRQKIKGAIAEASSAKLLAKHTKEWKYQIDYDPFDKKAHDDAVRLANKIAAIYEGAQL